MFVSPFSRKMITRKSILFFRYTRSYLIFINRFAKILGKFTNEFFIRIHKRMLKFLENEKIYRFSQ